MSENTAVVDPQVEAPELTEEEQAALDAAETSLDNFQAVATSAAEDADPTTGTLAPAQLKPVEDAYRAITGGAKFKNRAKNFIGEQMKDALNPETETPITKAVAWSSIQTAVLEAAPSKPAGTGKPTVSPEKVYADKVQSLRLAVDLVEMGTPEGLAEDWESKIDENDSIDVAQEYFDWAQADAENRGDEPEVSAVVKAAVKIALGRGPRKAGRPAGAPFNGIRRDVGAHIANAFADLNSGDFLTVSEIKNIKSPEYGDDAPSAGAISQRLFPKNKDGAIGECTVEGITPGENDKGINGAYKN